MKKHVYWRNNYTRIEDKSVKNIELCCVALEQKFIKVVKRSKIKSWIEKVKKHVLTRTGCLLITAASLSQKNSWSNFLCLSSRTNALEQFNWSKNFELKEYKIYPAAPGFPKPTFKRAQSTIPKRKLFQIQVGQTGPKAKIKWQKKGLIKHLFKINTSKKCKASIKCFKIKFYLLVVFCVVAWKFVVIAWEI